MQHPRSTSTLLRPAGRLTLGGCLLLLYLITATPLAPILTALLAVSDSGHGVTVQPTARGFSVVLRHNSSSPSDHDHQHGVIARALTRFAQHPASPQSDHVIQFGTLEAFQRSSVAASAPRPGSDPHATVVPPPSPSAANAIEPGAAFASLPRLPLAVCTSLLVVRSTVRLI